MLIFLRIWLKFTNVWCWKSTTQSTTEVLRTFTGSSSPSKTGNVDSRSSWFFFSNVNTDRGCLFLADGALFLNNVSTTFILSYFPYSWTLKSSLKNILELTLNPLFMTKVVDLWEILQPCGNSHRHYGWTLQRQRGHTHEARGKELQYDTILVFI